MEARDGVCDEGTWNARVELRIKLETDGHAIFCAPIRSRYSSKASVPDSNGGKSILYLEALGCASILYLKMIPDDRRLCELRLVRVFGMEPTEQT